MKLEEEIVQAKFKNEFNKAVVNILYTSNWLHSMHAKTLKPFGLTNQQFNILRILRGQHPNPATVRLLTERMLDKMSNASRLVEKLRVKGLVGRDTCTQDRRQVNVCITKEGLELLAKIDVRLEELEHERLRLISEEEASELSRILDKMRG